MINKHTLILIAAFLTFSACSNSNDSDIETNLAETMKELSEETPYSIRFLNEQVITDNEVGEPAIDNMGKVYIGSGPQIRVYDQSGTYLKNLGGRGRGPGEFSNMTQLFPVITENHLFAYDDMLQRINIFNTGTLKFYKAILLEPTKWSDKPGLNNVHIRNIYAVNDSTLVIKFRDNSATADHDLQNRYYLMNLDGFIISEQIFNHPVNQSYGGRGIPAPISPSDNVPLPNASTRSTLIHFDHHGKLYSVWNDDFLITILNYREKTTNSIHYSFENASLNPDDIIESYSFNRHLYNRARRESYPETWPAINQFLVDDQERIWVSTITNDEENYKWWVLDKNGDVITHFKWPGRRSERQSAANQLKAVKNNFLYARIENAEDDLVEIIRYEIELTEN